MEKPGPAEPGGAAPHDPSGVRLDAAPRGQALRVVAVEGEDAFSDRLAACGFWAGVELECLARAPFGGPLLFRIHGYRLALRRSEAERVIVTTQPGSGAGA